MATQRESGFEKFAALVVDELHATEERIVARFDARFDSLEKRVDVLEEDAAYIRREIYTISGRLDWLYEQLGNIPGFAKEIDDLRSRVKVLEDALLARA